MGPHLLRALVAANVAVFSTLVVASGDDSVNLLEEEHRPDDHRGEDADDAHPKARQAAAEFLNAACPNPVELEYGVGCTCSATSCGSYPDVATLQEGEAMIITSAYDGKFLQQRTVATTVESAAALSAKERRVSHARVKRVLEQMRSRTGADESTLRAAAQEVDHLEAEEIGHMTLSLDIADKKQVILGWGGAFTDSVAYHYQNLDEGAKAQLMEQYFGPTGIGYTLGRVPMNSADFSRMDYALDNVTDDLELEHFCLRDDRERDAPCGSDYKATAIKAAQAALDRATGKAEKLKLFVSSWSPPLWYKNQHFDCKKVHGIYDCSPNAAEQRVMHGKVIADPATCNSTVKKGEGCPTEERFGAELSVVDDDGSLLGADISPAASGEVVPGPVAASPPGARLGRGRGRSPSKRPSSKRKKALSRPSAEKPPSRSTMRTSLLQRATRGPAAAKQPHNAPLQGERGRGPATEELVKEGDGALAGSVDATASGKEMPVILPPAKAAAGNFYNRGFLSSNDTLQASYARLFSRFITEYKALGVDVWGITVQNEPMQTASRWQATYMTPELQIHFLVEHLGPTLRRDHPGLALMVHDDDLIHLPEFLELLLKTPEARPYVDGIAYHWYSLVHATFENEGAIRPSSVVDIRMGGGTYVQDAYDKMQLWARNAGAADDEGTEHKQKFLLMTEACNGYILGSDEWQGPRPGEWGYGYTYSHDILWQMHNGAAGWTDWNIILDFSGGPNLAGNMVDAPVLYKDSSTFVQNPSFFHLAHFSKYVVPGSHRVEAEIKCGLKSKAYCQAVAFLRPDGKAVVVLTNDRITVGPIASLGSFKRSFVHVPMVARGAEDEVPWTIRCGHHVVSGVAPWKSIQTIILPCD